MLKKIVPNEFKQQLLVSGVVFIIALFIGGRLILRYTFYKFGEYKQLRKRIVMENQIGKKLAELKKIREELPVVKESSQFLGEVAKIAGQLNIKLVTISALPIERYGEYTKISVKLDITTTYNELGNFVCKLETAKRFINIDEVSAQLTGKAEKKVVLLDVSITVSTFYLTDTSLEV